VSVYGRSSGFGDFGGCGGGWGEVWNSGLGGSKGPRLYTIEPRGWLGRVLRPVGRYLQTVESQDIFTYEKMMR